MWRVLSEWESSGSIHHLNSFYILVYGIYVGENSSVWKNPYNTEQIDAKIWMLKILYDCIYVLPPINPEMTDKDIMDNVKLNSNIYVFMYRLIIVLL